MRILWEMCEFIWAKSFKSTHFTSAIDFQDIQSEEMQDRRGLNMLNMASFWQRQCKCILVKNNCFLWKKCSSFCIWKVNRFGFDFAQTWNGNSAGLQYYCERFIHAWFTSQYRRKDLQLWFHCDFWFQERNGQEFLNWALKVPRLHWAKSSLTIKWWIYRNFYCCMSWTDTYKPSKIKRKTQSRKKSSL